MSKKSPSKKKSHDREAYTAKAVLDHMTVAERETLRREIAAGTLTAGTLELKAPTPDPEPKTLLELIDFIDGESHKIVDIAQMVGAVCDAFEDNDIARGLAHVAEDVAQRVQAIQEKANVIYQAAIGGGR
jgi:hypothetical protein